MTLHTAVKRNYTTKLYNVIIVKFENKCEVKTQFVVSVNAIKKRSVTVR